MKLVIRKNTFETNSSSHHSLIITNEANLEKDLAEKREDDLFFFCGGPHEPVRTKEEKVYFLAGLFDYETIDSNFMSYEYKIFLKVLEDNNEHLLLENIKAHRNMYIANRGEEPYCCNFFSNGPLVDCSCGFYTQFKKYFRKDETGISKEELYKNLYDFIYGDGIIVAYEEL